MWKAVLFDLDGTILDTLEDLAAAVNFALTRRGFPTHTTDEVREYVGNGVKILMDRAVPEGTPEDVTAEALAEFRRYYFDHAAQATKVYPGIPELLTGCRERGIQIGVVSNKFEAAVRELMDEYLPGLIDVSVGDREGFARKPDPANVKRAIAALGLSEQDPVCYVGDSETDVRTARNSRLPFFGVTWGFRDPGDLLAAGAGKEELCETPSELAAKLLR